MADTTAAGSSVPPRETEEVPPRPHIVLVGEGGSRGDRK